MRPRDLALPVVLALGGCTKHAPPPRPPAPVTAKAAPTRAVAEPAAPPTAPARALPTTLDAAAIDAWVAAELDARAVVGAQLAIYVEGAPVLVRSYGHARKDGEAVTDDTAFAIGSVTKQFICAAASLLAQRRKLSLADRVAKWYPELTRAKDITLDDLGSHLAGYPDYYPLDFVDRRMQQPVDPDALIHRYAGLPLDFEPRTRWSYSNTGFIVLGRVIEKVTREPLGPWLQRQVFAPLGMDHATFVPAPTQAGLAHGHASFALGEPEPIDPEADGWLHAAGGIYASATDLVRWDLAVAEQRLLAPAAWRRITTPRTLVDGRSTDYGCGMGVRRLGGETVLSHSGAVSGFAAYNAIVPRTRSAVVLLVNTEGSSVGDVHQALLGLVLARPADVPAVAGPPATEVARRLFAQLQSGQLDRAGLGEELSVYYDEARVRAAAPRLAALGELREVTAERPRERGGMEVTSVTLHFAERQVKTLLYRSSDGTVQEFLLLHD